MNYNSLKGSEWRKWDLHFHTPSSYDYKNKGISDEEIIERLSKKEIFVVAITDHHLIDVDRIKKLQDLGSKKNITVLPGIELRCELGGSESIHFIGIFSEESNIDDIWTDLQSNCGLKPSQVIKKGNEKVYVDLNDTAKLIHSLGGLISIHAGSKTNTIENITNSLSYKMAIKVDLVENIDIYELGKIEDQKGYSENVFPNIGKNIPMIICSDNHNINRYSLKENLWIKSNPTFEGLKQIIYEPNERVFIGDEPELLKRVRENKLKFITSLKITQVNGYDEKYGVWFKDNYIPMNHGLVAIIGNRGKGKSAIADILGLSGNSYRYEDFSFIKADRFLKDGLAENFQAELEWESGEKIPKNLSDQIDRNSPERVRYIPQNFFEKLTNNLENYQFEKTLEDIVFSYLPEEQNSGKSSFEELLDYKKKNIERNISVIFKDLNKLNEQIISLEKKIHPDYKEQIKNKLDLKSKELEQHEKIKPQKVDVTPETDEQKKLTSELNRLNGELDDIIKNIKENEAKNKNFKIEIEELNEIKDDINAFDQEIRKYKFENNEKLSKYGLDINKILKFDVDFTTLNDRITYKENDLKNVKDLLVTNNEIESIFNPDERVRVENISLRKKETDKKQELESIKKKLSEPEIKYQKYLESLKAWEEQKKQLVGDENNVYSIKWLNDELSYINKNLSTELITLREKRINKVLEIYSQKSDLVQIYSQIKNAIDQEISQYKTILGGYDISIEAALKLDQGFYEKFLGYIHQGVNGSFRGTDEGKNVLGKLISNAGFNSEDKLKILLKDIIKYLEVDKREKYDDELRNIKDQILIENNWLEFYNYIFLLNYLEPFYELKISNKQLAQLSPGEKGALLIVFYLLLDKEEIPLIIDQPEENLDNESIYKILTHFIKLTKKKRQVIIVTHNPNLAIVGDAEQIIFVSMDKKNGNKFSYEAGAIEDSKINKHASDVLEGTLKAFDIRRLKYLQI